MRLTKDAYPHPGWYDGHLACGSSVGFHLILVVANEIFVH